MKTNFLFNKSTAARALDIYLKQIKSVREWAFVLLVVGKHFSRFVSKRLFCKAFVLARQERAEQIKILAQFSENGNTIFQVENLENNHRNRVIDSGFEISCSCDDYKEQKTHFGKGACKHIYAVLGHYGFASLKQYKAAKQQHAYQKAKYEFASDKHYLNNWLEALPRKITVIPQQEILGKSYQLFDWDSRTIIARFSDDYGWVNQPIKHEIEIKDWKRDIYEVARKYCLGYLDGYLKEAQQAKADLGI
jgi:predicted nucleic acid-binding Zn finger protein